MSHYATIKCSCLDDVKAKTLQKALKRINSKYSIKMLKDLAVQVPSFGCNAVLMHGTMPTSIRMNIVRTAKGKTKLELGGEDYRSEIKLEEFSQQLQRTYNTIRVEDFARQESLQPLYKKVEENGDVVMRFRVAG